MPASRWGQGQGETGESVTRHDPRHPLEVPEKLV